MKIVIDLLSLILVFGITVPGICGLKNPARNTLLHGALEREYLLYIPDRGMHPGPLPVLFCLHGGGGTARGMIRLTYGRFHELAEEHGFLVVYPQGIGKSWNDGRTGDHSTAAGQKIDDVGFFRAMIEVLLKEYPVDRGRIYACGISNGGFMSHRLACEMSDLLSGAAIITATLGKEFARQCQASQGVDMLFINGTEDPLVPYNGGFVKIFRQTRGEIISTKQAVDQWVERNGCSQNPQIETLPDLDPYDGTRVQRYSYLNPSGGREVNLLEVRGGGHTWPGGRQYLEKRLIGKTSHDINACDEIWAFLNNRR